MTNSNYETQYIQKNPDQYLNIAISVVDPDAKEEEDKPSQDNGEEEDQDLGQEEQNQEDTDTTTNEEAASENGEVVDPVEEGPSFIE